jgi:hypothetical protein
VVDVEGGRKHLRREEDVLNGKGRIGFGAWPDDDVDGAINYDCGG